MVGLFYLNGAGSECGVGDDKAASYDTASYDTASYDTATYNAASNDASSHDASSHDASSYNASSYDASSYDASSYDASSYDASSYDTSTHHDAMIFVQIAAYRDPELLPTIQDALSKAKYPADLRFGVCWQHGDEETGIQAFANNPQFRVDDVPWRQSQGLGWARARLQKMWEGEEFTLQLDSHHRFVQDWDVLLRKDCESTGSPKPIITSYAGTYDPTGVQAPATEPYCMVADRFTPHGTIVFVPHVIKGWRNWTVQFAPDS